MAVGDLAPQPLAELDGAGARHGFVRVVEKERLKVARLFAEGRVRADRDRRHPTAAVGGRRDASIDAVGDEQRLVGGEVERREAECFSAAGPAGDLALDPPRTAEQATRFFDIAGAEGAADTARRDRLAAFEDGLDLLDLEAEFGAEAAGQLDVAAAAVAVAKVVAEHEPAHAEFDGQPAQEILGLDRRERLVEGLDDDMVDPGFGQQGDAPFGGGQGSRRGAAQDGLGVRRKGHDDRNAADSRGRPAGGVDQRPVSRMNAVEIADRQRHRRRPDGRGGGGEGAVDLHGWTSGRHDTEATPIVQRRSPAAGAGRYDVPMERIDADRGEIRILESFLDVEPAAWDALISDGDPFVRHAFLAALEASGSASAETGWTPRPLVWTFRGRLIGAAPVWRKAHSFGEFVFDFAWADAYARSGRAYYPKWVVAVPFVPATGPRLLLHPGIDAAAGRRRLFDAMLASAAAEGASGVHVLFPDEADRAAAPEAWLRREDVQYHWIREGERDFQDYVSGLRSKKRKQILREREAVRAAGVSIRVVEGVAADEALMRAFHGFYAATHHRHGQPPYLTESFFLQLQATMPEQLLLVAAERDGRLIGGTLNLIGREALFGRWWGASEPVPGLHFECAYYTPIEETIARGLARFEAGAQGEHKFLRGFQVRPTWSLHALFDPQAHAALSHWTDRERAAVEARAEALRRISPHKKERANALSTPDGGDAPSHGDPPAR